MTTRSSISVAFGVALAVVVSTTLAGTPTVAKEPPIPQLRITGRAAHPRAQAHPVAMVVDGRAYPRGTWITKGAKPADSGPEEEFLVRALQVYATGSGEDAVALWDAGERAEMRRLMGDQETFERNQAFYRRISASELVAKVLYGDYTLFLVTHVSPSFDPVRKVYPVERVEGTYYLTNALVGDPLYGFLSMAFMEDLLQLEAAAVGEECPGASRGASTP